MMSKADGASNTKDTHNSETTTSLGDSDVLGEVAGSKDEEGDGEEEEDEEERDRRAEGTEEEDEGDNTGHG